ncbi:hypothetical protein [Streptomyces sp. NPDC057696]|uniref:hypothetical protein n=1 Tax=unclassified Streptomyces TaxID=2593676 RepID=UPI0036CCAC17
MVKRQWTDAPSMGISPLADDHLVVAYGHFPRTTRSTTVNAGGKGHALHITLEHVLTTADNVIKDPPKPHPDYASLIDNNLSSFWWGLTPTSG